MNSEIANTLPDVSKCRELAPLRELPKISVLMACYDYARYLPMAVESVLKQSYQNYELIICDDGSRDNSAEVAERYVRADPRVRLLRKSNGGQASAWNAGYRESNGEIICLLDADDIFLAHKLEYVAEEFRSRPQVGFLTHPVMVVNETGNDIQRSPLWARLEEGDLAECIARRGGCWRAVPTSALSFRRELAECAFPVPESSFRRDADGFIFMLLPLLTPVGVIQKPLSQYRIHNSNLTLGQINERSLKVFIELTEACVNAVNLRLAGLCLDLQLDVRCNPQHAEQAMLLSLLEGKPRDELIRRYSTWRRLVRTSDSLGRIARLFGSWLFLVAIMAPLGVRKHLLSIAYRPNRLKQKIHIALRWFGFVGN